ncbi:MAG: D-glycero-beta-D-manno-heptose-7-phosphate kinase [Candidatus Eisenbacteria bacterium]|nr:D-glycero-beta-D-manno-heptose-7-phosphate kinase [Candidatus Eisenbacteria bacterium]
MTPTIDPARAADLFSRFRSLRVLVAGDLMLDRYVFGEVSRISPEAPVPVVRVVREEERLGGAANVARNLLALGAEPMLCGVIGDDADGEALLDLLGAAGMSTGLVVRAPGRPTTRKVRILANQQQVVRVDHEREDPLDAETEERIGDLLSEAVLSADGLVLSDYAKGVVSERSVRRAIDASGIKRPVFVDPKVKHFSFYRGASLVTPNLAEASLAAGERIIDDASLLRAGRRLLEMLPGTTVLVTRGAEGMSLFEPDGTVTHIGTVARRVFDVTGAGDTVIAAFAAASLAGGSGVEAAIVANRAAGEVVQESGAAAVSLSALERAFRGE